MLLVERSDMTSPHPPRPGQTLATRRGEVALPVFLPDATRAVVRGVSTRQLGEVGIDALLVSAAHLATRPGASVVSALGGVHRFMGWDGPVVSDSGGFQAFSLGERSGLLQISSRGLKYRFSTKDKHRSLTPRSAIEGQLRIGADIVYCLDLCTHPGGAREEQERSVDLTLRWAQECRAVFDELTARRGGDRPLLFAVVQGGAHPDLRARCATELAAMGFDGFGFGGYPVDSGHLVEAVAELPALLPADVPLHGLGIGSPGLLVEAWRAGYTIFDCVLPTRNGRRGVLYTELPADPATAERTGRAVDITSERWVREAGPVDPDCDCPACTTYSGAYLSHLFRIEDRLAATLGSLHNLRFYSRLVERLREGPPRAAVA